MTEQEAREALVEYGRSLFLRGYSCGTSGNLSVRLAGGGFLMSPTNVSLGRLTVDTLSRLDVDGRASLRRGADQRSVAAPRHVCRAATGSRGGAPALDLCGRALLPHRSAARRCGAAVDALRDHAGRARGPGAVQPPRGHHARPARSGSSRRRTGRSCWRTTGRWSPGGISRQRSPPPRSWKKRRGCSSSWKDGPIGRSTGNRSTTCSGCSARGSRARGGGGAAGPRSAGSRSDGRGWLEATSRLDRHRPSDYGIEPATCA